MRCFGGDHQTLPKLGISGIHGLFVENGPISIIVVLSLVSNAVCRCDFPLFESIEIGRRFLSVFIVRPAFSKLGPRGFELNDHSKRSKRGVSNWPVGVPSKTSYGGYLAERNES